MAERGYEELLSTAEGDDAVTEDWYRDDYESKIIVFDEALVETRLHTSEFIETNKQNIQQFGELFSYDDSQALLEAHRELISEETVHYLADWCMEFEKRQEFIDMGRVSHQTIIIQFIIELSQALGVDPSQCISLFLTSIKTLGGPYESQFRGKLQAFRKHIKQSVGHVNVYKGPIEGHKQEEEHSDSDEDSSGATEATESSSIKG